MKVWVPPMTGSPRIFWLPHCPSSSSSIMGFSYPDNAPVGFSASGLWFSVYIHLSLQIWRGVGRTVCHPTSLMDLRRVTDVSVCANFSLLLGHSGNSQAPYLLDQKPEGLLLNFETWVCYFPPVTDELEWTYSLFFKRKVFQGFKGMLLIIVPGITCKRWCVVTPMGLYLLRTLTSQD